MHHLHDRHVALGRTAARRTGCRSGSRRRSRSGRAGAAAPARPAGRCRVRRRRGRPRSRRRPRARTARGREPSATSRARPPATHRRAIWCMYCSAPPAWGWRTSRQLSTTTRAPSRLGASGATGLSIRITGAPAEVEDGAEAAPGRRGRGGRSNRRRRSRRRGARRSSRRPAGPGASSSTSKAKPVVRTRAIAVLHDLAAEELEAALGVGDPGHQLAGPAGGTPSPPARRRSGCGDHEAARRARAGRRSPPSAPARQGLDGRRRASPAGWRGPRRRSRRAARCWSAGRGGRRRPCPAREQPMTTTSTLSVAAAATRASAAVSSTLPLSTTTIRLCHGLLVQVGDALRAGSRAGGPTRCRPG